MFTTLIVKPLFNLLVLIYGLIPGHNFGLAIVLFTVIIRIMMWPLVKKQLHQAKAMRELQPELRRIKKEAKGDRQKESLMMMELYKEKEINPFSSIGLLFVQLPIFLGLYSGLNRIVHDPRAIVDFSYGWVSNLSWIKELGADISRFDNTFFGLVDLTRSAIPKGGGAIYWPAMIIVAGSAIMQYYQSKQLLPNDKDSRSLKKLLKDAGSGKPADQAEVNAAVGRSTRYILPGFIFLVTVNIPSALSLYWLTSGVTAFLQQARVLKGDEEEMEASVEPVSATDVIEGEILAPKPKNTQKSSKKKGAKKSKRR